MGNECKTDYTLDLKALPKGIHKFKYLLDDDYFESLELEDVKHGKVDMEVIVDKKVRSITITFGFKGEVESVCERCLGRIIVPVENVEMVNVKFGEVFEDDYESITIPERIGLFDMKDYFYQLIESALPMFRVHPDGECDKHMIEILERMSAAPTDEKNEIDEVDPRWAALKNILNN